MNDTRNLTARPDVTAFVARVRSHLGDLSEEEREELVGGLEADLSERLADGEAELGDPATYAAELRAAAGLDGRVRGRQPRNVRRLLRADVTAGLDRLGAGWERLMATHPWLTWSWDVAQVMRPAWWVLRAWVAVQLLDWVAGPTEYLTVVPSLGVSLLGPVLLLVAVVLSVQLGRGRLWPATRLPRSWPREALLALNTVAVAAGLMVWGQFPDAWSAHALSNGQIYSDGREHFGPGLRTDNHYVRNVFAYDATGKPLTGVQLYDEQGRPLGVTEDRYYGSYRLVGSRVQTYSWLNGVQPLWNVFPLPVREQRGDRRPRDAWTSTNPPAVPTAPLAVVPPASLPTATPQAAGPTPSGSPSAGPSADSEKTAAR